MDLGTRHGQDAAGTMATRVRGFDWAATGLGARATWPASLVTTVEVLLANPSPMLLWWGERAIQIYNDAACRDVLGNRHPRALGAPAAKTWADVWPRLGPAVDRVRAGDGAAVLEVVTAELGFARRDWRLSLGPVPDDRGGVGGVLVIAHEIEPGVRAISDPTAPRGPRILIAESQPKLRAELAQALATRWEIAEAADGQAALAALDSGSFDVIVADRALAGIDCLDFVRAIRQREAITDVPVMIVSTAGDEEEVHLDSPRTAIDDYLVAPISGRDLVARVSVQLRFAAIRRDRARLLAGERDARRVADVQSEYLHSLFMQAPAAIALLRGPEHVVVLSNEAMAAAWGRMPNESIGRPLFEALPQARAAFKTLLDRVYQSGEPYLGKELQYRMEQIPDGTDAPRYANVLYTPLRDAKGQIEGVCVIGVDITDEVRATEEMQRLGAEAEAANRAKDEFLAILGHELRNPLSPISTSLQVMRLRGASGRELEVLERQVGHLTRLVDDLLDVSRAIRGKIELHRRDVELAEVVLQALEVASPLLEQRRHLVDVDVPRQGLGVNVDPARMVQAIANLLTNAAKYSDPGSRITIRAGRTDDRIRISVRDRGVGIPPEMLRRVFDPFVQQAQTIDRARGGLGLGLPIVRSLAELHGGSVTVTSDGVGLGSEFTIDLPALLHEVTGSAKASAQPGSEAEPEPAQPARILVVDDNEDAAATLGDALEHLGYEVAVAHDGPSALRVAASFEPDLALLDIGLPVMDGYELAGRLRAQRPAGDRPHLVAVTGYGQESDRQQTARAGFEHHLVKPVNLAVLSKVVAELVGAHSPRP